eukprot:3940577-Rhodomonas_salina.1
MPIRNAAQYVISERVACIVPDLHYTLSTSVLKCWGSGGFLGLGDRLHRGGSDTTMGVNLPAVDIYGTTGASVDGPIEKLWLLSTRTGNICVKFASMRVKCFGSAAYGLLLRPELPNNEIIGDEPGEMGDALPYFELSSTATINDIQPSHGNFACATLSDWTVKCWGKLTDGIAGTGSTDTVILGDDEDEVGDGIPTIDMNGLSVAGIAPGERHVCARMMASIGVRCWGWNGEGQLGQGISTMNVATPPSSDLRYLNNQYQIRREDSIKCRECRNTCNPNTEFQQVSCSGGTDALCTACSQCKSNIEYQTKSCTDSSDATCVLCTICDPGQYSESVCSQQDDTVCANCSDFCAAGEIEVQTCSGANNRICSPCPAGRYCP